MGFLQVGIFKVVCYFFLLKFYYLHSEAISYTLIDLHMSLFAGYEESRERTWRQVVISIKLLDAFRRGVPYHTRIQGRQIYSPLTE